MKHKKVKYKYRDVKPLILSVSINGSPFKPFAKISPNVNIECLPKPSEN